MRPLREPRLSKPIARLCWRLAAVVVGCLAVASSAQPPELTPLDVEAAYLYNFGKFVRWPADAGTTSEPFSLCILGDDEFAKAVERLTSGENIQGRAIVVRRPASIEFADQCQIVFLGGAEAPRLAKDIQGMQGRSALTVSALPEFLKRGGMIQFMLQSKRVRFSVNLPAAQQAKLSLSSELLKVAINVIAGSAGGGA
jgi:hypothetical protein